MESKQKLILKIIFSLHRQPKHLLDFLLAELGTSGSVDGNSQLIIKGRFQQKQIEIVLRRYIKEYVTCHTCRSPNTILQKDTRIFFLQCEDCGSRCSVASIKSGFQVICQLSYCVGCFSNTYVVMFSGCHRKTCRHSSKDDVSWCACVVEGLAGVHNAIFKI
jgi:Domain found in IF2B/IF5